MTHLSKLNKILLSVIAVLVMGAATFHTPTAIKYVKENYVEHENNNIAMIMNGRGHGTGFFIRHNILVTNAHVVGDKDRVKVQLVNNAIIDGEVVGVDKLHDLAFVKVAFSKSKVTVLDTEHLRRGDVVSTIGFGRSTWYSARFGKVLYHYLLDIPQYGIKATYVRASLGVLPGHSGSPVFNSEGKVVGIISLGGGGEAMFVPAHYIKAFEKQYLTFLKKAAMMKIKEKQEAQRKAREAAKRATEKPEV